MGGGSKDVLLVGQNHRTPIWASWMHLGFSHHRVGLRVTLSTNWTSTDFGASMWFLTHTFRKFHDKYIKCTSHPACTHLFWLWNNIILFSVFETLCLYEVNTWLWFLRNHSIFIGALENWKKKSPIVFHCSSILWALNLTSPVATSGQLSSGHRTGKGQFSFQSQRKAMPKNAQTTVQLHSSYTLVK